MRVCQARLPKPECQNRNFCVCFWKPEHPCKPLSILQDFIPLLFALASDHSSTVFFWDFPGLSNKNNNNKPNEPSKERAWTFSWRRQYGYSWILPASCPLSQKRTLLPSAPQRHTKFAYDVTVANHIHLPGWLCFLMKGPVSELMVGQERGTGDASKKLLYGFLSTRKAVDSVWSGSIWGFSYTKKVHNFIWFVSYISV